MRERARVVLPFELRKDCYHVKNQTVQVVTNEPRRRRTVKRELSRSSPLTRPSSTAKPSSREPPKFVAAGGQLQLAWLNPKELDSTECASRFECQYQDTGLGALFATWKTLACLTSPEQISCHDGGRTHHIHAGEKFLRLGSYFQNRSFGSFERH